MAASSRDHVSISLYSELRAIVVMISCGVALLSYACTQITPQTGVMQVTNLSRLGRLMPSYQVRVAVVHLDCIETKPFVFDHDRWTAVGLVLPSFPAARITMCTLKLVSWKRRCD